MKYDPKKHPMWEQWKLYKAKVFSFAGDVDEETLLAEAFEKFVKGNETKPS